MVDIVQKVASELSLGSSQVHNVIKLLFDEECTIPFVARYRKEMTGSLDEGVLRSVRDRYHYLKELEASKAKYLKVVEEHCQKNPAYKGRFPELKKKFEACTTRQELEDLYLPFKPKRRTRAQIAKEKGLEPLLEKILGERAGFEDLEAVAGEYVTPADASVDDDKRVPDVKSALAGAADILAERINETASWRGLVRNISLETGMLVSKKIEEKPAASNDSETKKSAGGTKKKAGKKSDASKYENYFDYREALQTAPSHRVMAVRRGEAEKILRVSIEVDQERILRELKASVLGEDPVTDVVKGWIEGVVEDAYRRLLGPSIETELRLMIKNQAENDAIEVFSKNLQNLLLLPPIPHKVVLGVDPGLRTGSKLAVVDETGKLLDSATIYPDLRNENSEKTQHARKIIGELIERHNVQCVAVGNGTGSREIDRIITAVTRSMEGRDIKRVVVNEAGASVYSTDEIAREEFPDLDATIRSAISIARRLQDPLAELVKISPRSIGVGQYQHDVNPTKLGKSLEEVVESCVNKVGVNLNTASYKLLGYVSGVGPALAKNIVGHRDHNGRFPSRDKLLEVPGFGPKAYEQAAGFLRVPESENPLDNSAVHPERYEIVEMITRDLAKDVKEVVGQKEIVESIPWEKYVSESVGMPTLKDISEELIKPGRDPRDEGARLLFSDDVSEIEDLTEGMQLQGTVTNVTNFGAFVDIGVHQDGLVHISEISENFVKDPSQVVSVGDILNVTVIEVDVQRRRISLSCKRDASRGRSASRSASATAGSGAAKQGNGSRPAAAREGGRSRPGKGKKGRGQKAPAKNYSVNDLVAKFNK